MLLTFIVAGVLGYAAGVATGDALRKKEKDLHGKIEDELHAEITRLRVQAAKFIGLEK